MRYTDEELAFFRRRINRMTFKQLGEAYEKQFGRKVKGVNLNKTLRDHGIKKTPQKDTLCWDCVNSVPNGRTGCEWSITGEPVHGWKAKKTKIKCTMTVKSGGKRYLYTQYTDSFIVRKCPKFERG